MEPTDRSAASIEVVVQHVSDAVAAQDGGADRLHVAGRREGELRTIEPGAVSAIVRATDLPVRVTLRLSAGLTTQGGELTRLAGLVSDFRSVGVEGFVFGFLTGDLEVDTEVCAALVDLLDGAPWTFDRTFDRALDARVAWRQVRRLPGLDTIHTSGSTLGLATGLDDLLDLAAADPAFALTAAASEGLQAEHVPWLVRAGIRRLHLGAVVRPGSSWDRAHVDPGFVRSWRLLLDDAVGAAQGLHPRAG